MTVSALTTPELYGLAWEISEELVRREQARLISSLTLQAEPATATATAILERCCVCSDLGCEFCPKVAA